MCFFFPQFPLGSALRVEEEMIDFPEVICVLDGNNHTALGDLIACNFARFSFPLASLHHRHVNAA